VDDAPELGGAGALGGNGGNGRGAFGAAGVRDRPPEAELFTVDRTLERTLERDSALAKLELVATVPLVLVLSSTRRDDVLRTTVFPLGGMTLFERTVRRSRSLAAAFPTRRNGSIPAGASTVGVGTTIAGAGADGRAAVISTGPGSTT